MAITVTTRTPDALLSKIKKAIDDGKISTWSHDDDGDFTHDVEQWRNRAWLSPQVETSELLFGIVSPKGVNLEKQVYGLYHGRFIDMLLTHFDEDFVTATASALPITPDRV